MPVGSRKQLDDEVCSDDGEESVKVHTNMFGVNQHRGEGPNGP